MEYLQRFGTERQKFPYHLLNFPVSKRHVVRLVCWFWKNPYHYSTLVPTGLFWQMVSTHFKIARDQVVHFENAVNLWASRRKANDFFAVFFYFRVGRYNKTLNDWPHGNSEFCFPSSLIDLKGRFRLTTSSSKNRKIIQRATKVCFVIRHWRCSVYVNICLTFQLYFEIQSYGAARDMYLRSVLLSRNFKPVRKFSRKSIYETVGCALEIISDLDNHKEVHMFTVSFGHHGRPEWI